MQFVSPTMPFYVNADTEVVVDPLARPPTVQNTLLQELRRCEELVQRDYRYAHLVAGASKMAMSMIWAVRNQDELVNDTDLAMFKDLAWNEFVKKRFLPTLSESSVCASATSMLEIVRDMNLQRRRFQIMGLHEQVEASEIQLVLHLCQAGILRCEDYRRAANRFRRSDRLFEAFALAVGANVCATAPLTLGAATPRYERDLQYEYRKNAIALFVYVLKKNPGPVEPGIDEDYVARIARLIVVSPSSCRRLPGRVGGDGGDDDDDRYGRLSNATAIAQNLAEDAGKALREVGHKVDKYHEGYQSKLQTEIAGVNSRISRIEGDVQHNADRGQGYVHTARIELEADIERLDTGMRAFNGEFRGLMAAQDGRLNMATAGMQRDLANFQTTFATLFQNQGRGADGGDTALAVAIASVVASVKAQCIAELNPGLLGLQQQNTEFHRQISALSDRVATQRPVQVGAPDQGIQDRLAGLEETYRVLHRMLGGIPDGAPPNIGETLNLIRRDIAAIYTGAGADSAEGFGPRMKILADGIIGLRGALSNVEGRCDGLGGRLDKAKTQCDKIEEHLDESISDIDASMVKLRHDVNAVRRFHGVTKPPAFKAGKLPRSSLAGPTQPTDDSAQQIIDNAIAKADAITQDAIDKTAQMARDANRAAGVASERIAAAVRKAEELADGAAGTVTAEIGRLDTFYRERFDAEIRAMRQAAPPQAASSDELGRRVAALQRVVEENLGPVDFEAFDHLPLPTSLPYNLMQP